MRKVLYVDHSDMKDVAKGIANDLKKLGIDCTFASRFESVLILLSKEKYDALLIEPVYRDNQNHINIKNGVELIEKVKKEYDRLPIIVFTTLPDAVSNDLKIRNLNMSGLITKGSDYDVKILQMINLVLNLQIDPNEIIGINQEYRARIFISYAKEDFLEAYAIYEILTANSYQPWIDKEMLLPGQDWDLEIEKAIEDCDFFLACLSGNSVTKEGYVQKELKRGLDFLDRKPEGSIYLIPVRLNKCNVPKRFEKLQWLDFFEDTGADSLLKAIRVGCHQRGLLT